RAWSSSDWSDLYSDIVVSSGKRVTNEFAFRGHGSARKFYFQAMEDAEDEGPQELDGPPINFPARKGLHDATIIQRMRDQLKDERTKNLLWARDMNALQRRMQYAPPMLYDRLIYPGNAQLFYDLPSHARGLNTSRADIEAVLEAEAMPELRNVPGRIVP